MSDSQDRKLRVFAGHIGISKLSLDLLGNGVAIKASKYLEELTHSGEDSFLEQIEQVRNHLYKALGGFVKTQPMVYHGPADKPFTVITVNPLEILGDNLDPEAYTAQCVRSAGDLFGNNVRRQVKAGGLFHLHPKTINRWKRLPLHPYGRDTYTLWELPAMPATLFKPFGEDSLYSVSQPEALDLLKGHLLGDIISWAAVYSGEDGLRQQLLSGGRLEVLLPGTIFELPSGGRTIIGTNTDPRNRDCGYLGCYSYYQAYPRGGYLTFTVPPEAA